MRFYCNVLIVLLFVCLSIPLFGDKHPEKHFHAKLPFSLKDVIIVKVWERKTSKTKKIHKRSAIKEIIHLISFQEKLSHFSSYMKRKPDVALLFKTKTRSAELMLWKENGRYTYGEIGNLYFYRATGRFEIFLKCLLKSK